MEGSDAGPPGSDAGAPAAADAGMGAADAGPAVETDAGPPALPPCWSADFDANRIVDDADAATFEEQLGQEVRFPGELVGDLDRDGDVDEDDRRCLELQRGGPGANEQIITPPLADARGFGGHLSVDGDRFVVASHAHVWVYERGAEGWEMATELPAPSGHTFEHPRVALSGDRVAVGDDGVFVYERGGSGWSLAASFPGRSLGAAIDIDGDVIVVGSTARYAGVYERVGGSWVDEGGLPVDGRPGGFGLRVAVSDGLVLVGASTANEVHSFVRGSAGWEASQVLDAPSGHDAFGIELALDDAGAVVLSRDMTGSSFANGFARDASGRLTASPRVPVAGNGRTQLSHGRYLAGFFNQAALTARTDAGWSAPFGVRQVLGHTQFPSTVEANAEEVLVGMRRVDVDRTSSGVTDEQPGVVIAVRMNPR